MRINRRNVNNDRMWKFELSFNVAVTNIKQKLPHHYNKLRQTSKLIKNTKEISQLYG